MNASISVEAGHQAGRRSMHKEVFAAAFISCFGVAMADDQTHASTGANAFNPMQAASVPIVRIVREGRTCYEETSTQKMVEACYEGKTYYTPLTEKTRVKVKCPAKAKTHE